MANSAAHTGLQPCLTSATVPVAPIDPPTVLLGLVGTMVGVFEDPWDQLNRRYESDDQLRFEVVLDAFETVLAALEDGGVAPLRRALITVDYVVDVLLARRIARLVHLSESGFAWESRQRFDSRTRGLLRQRYNARLQLAVRPYHATFAMGLGDPILSESQAAVLRVAHSYRNDVYHEDRHPRTLTAIVPAALLAAAEAWTVSLPEGVASSVSDDNPLLKRLEGYGYRDPEWASFGAGRHLSLHAGAKAFLTWLGARNTFDFVNARRVLAQDIVERNEWAESMREWLMSPSGPGEERLAPALRRNDFWRQHGDDPDLVRLDAERRSAYSDLLDAAEQRREDRAVVFEAAEERYNTRLQELLAQHQPTVTLQAVGPLKRRGNGLRQAKSPSALLDRYRVLDLELRTLEDAFAEVATDWDAFVQTQVDRARGKTPMISWIAEDGTERAFFLD